MKLWPVIHVASQEAGQSLGLSPFEMALSNLEIAQRCGAHGVFLISMDGDDDAIDPIARLLRQRHPAFRLGVNYLSLGVAEALDRSIAQGFDATWLDASAISSAGVGAAAIVAQVRVAAVPEHEVFASVAFKYQAVDPDPALAARHAAWLGFIPTTSGVGTGVAADVSKLRSMKEALGPGGQLAVASGVTPENVHESAPHLTHILVATGVSLDEHRFDEARMRALSDRLKTLA